MFKGVCCTRWLNPDRPLPPELAQALPAVLVGRQLAEGGSSSSSRGSRL